VTTIMPQRCALRVTTGDINSMRALGPGSLLVHGPTGLQVLPARCLPAERDMVIAGHAALQAPTPRDGDDHALARRFSGLAEAAAADWDCVVLFHRLHRLRRTMALQDLWLDGAPALFGQDTDRDLPLVLRDHYRCPTTGRQVWVTFTDALYFPFRVEALTPDGEPCSEVTLDPLRLGTSEPDTALPTVAAAATSLLAATP
jgi:hypothetical protein